MGYKAYGSGVILLQKENRDGYAQIAKVLGIEAENVVEAILEKIEEEYETYLGGFEESGDGNAYEISVSTDYGNYYEEDINKLLTLIMPVLKAGTEIIYEGDEDCHWVFRSLVDGAYEEVNGSIVYEGPQCESETCAYACRGECRFHAVFGEYPKIGEEYELGCSEFVWKGKATGGVND